MFIKIINYSDDTAIEKGSPRTKCYDCKKYLIYKGGTEKEFSIAVDVGEQHDRVMEFPKKNHSVIVMNNEGKTIDRYSWKKI